MVEKLELKIDKGHLKTPMVSWTNHCGDNFEDGLGFINHLITQALFPEIIKPKHLHHLNEFINFIPTHFPSETYLASFEKIQQSMMAFLLSKFKCNLHLHDGLVDIWGTGRYSLSTVTLTIDAVQGFYQLLIEKGRYSDSNPIGAFHQKIPNQLNWTQFTQVVDGMITNYCSNQRHFERNQDEEKQP